MPHAALWVVQRHGSTWQSAWDIVSMPHAALWVVQHKQGHRGAAFDSCFNAARGFVGGAASSLAALVPLGGKSSFGKSPEIRAF